MFANVIDRMLIDLCTTIDQQTVVLDLYRSLIQKNAIGKDKPRQRIEYLYTRFKGQLRRIDANDDDFDNNPALMKSAFYVAMFAKQYRLSGAIKADIYRWAYETVVERPIDVTKNRTFLGNLSNDLLNYHDDRYIVFVILYVILLLLL